VRPSAATFAALALALAVPSPLPAAPIQPDDCLAARRKDTSHEAACYSLVHDGRKRTLRVYVPPKHSEALPVVLVLHGGGGTGGGMEWLTRRGFNRIADRDGAIIVYPDGIDRGWNDGRSANRSAADAAVDDVGFLRALPGQLAPLHPIDRARLYVTGISNGGMMSYRLACDAAEVFAAAAPVAANMAVELDGACHPARAMPLLIMNGVDDPIMPWEGGLIRVLWMTRGRVLSSEASAARWLSLDRCGALEPQPLIEPSPADGTSAAPRSARCADGAEVRLYEIRGGGHTWPGGEPYLTSHIVGRVSHALDANETIWEFFRRQALSSSN
jgi:polyhydroxybutyrate depolymerase